MLSEAQMPNHIVRGAELGSPAVDDNEMMMVR